MDNQIKELIAIGASITANCHPCLKYHVGKAQESGVDQQQIAEAIAVGLMVRKGAAGKMDELVSTLAKGASATCDTGEASCGDS